MKIVVVEDDPDVLYLVRLWATIEDNEVVGFRDPQRALDSRELWEADIVISDMSMPRVHGVEVLEQVHEVTPETRLIAITAMSSDGMYRPVGETGPTLKDRLVRIGAQVLEKPFRSGIIQRMLQP